jgi:hypothetical protein
MFSILHGFVETCAATDIHVWLVALYASGMANSLFNLSVNKDIDLYYPILSFEYSVIGRLTLTGLDMDAH